MMWIEVVAKLSFPRSRRREEAEPREDAKTFRLVTSAATPDETSSMCCPILLAKVAAGRRRFGVRCLGLAFGRRLVAVKPPVRFAYHEPLNAALLGRQAGQAAKAVTSRRTPKARQSRQPKARAD